jgi:predicted glycoside hydrolase/deacetylase ChbG (UPF0249 family)
VGGRVFFVADDFGLSDGVCDGIAQALGAGVVAAASAMMCVDGIAPRVARAGELMPRLGVHLQLTDGTARSPAGAVPSLVDPQRRFARRPPPSPAWRAEEVLAEWRAQLDYAAWLGLAPTHVDAHHHVFREPAAFVAYAELARGQRLRARALNPRMAALLRARGVECFDGCVRWYGEEPTLDELGAAIDRGFAEAADGATLEVMCHPARADAELPRLSSRVTARERELEILCSPALGVALRERGITVLSAASRC